MMLTVSRTPATNPSPIRITLTQGRVWNRLSRYCPSKKPTMGASARMNGIVDRSPTCRQAVTFFWSFSVTAGPPRDGAPRKPCGEPRLQRHRDGDYERVRLVEGVGAVKGKGGARGGCRAPDGAARHPSALPPNSRRDASSPPRLHRTTAPTPQCSPPIRGRPAI